MTPCEHRAPALPLTVIAAEDMVHLVAGEDVRLSIRAAGLAAGFAALLKQCDGKTPVETLLLELPELDRPRARQLLDRLHGERILCDGPVELVAVPSARYRPTLEGSGALVRRLQTDSAGEHEITILCQDTLDYRTALEFNRRCLASRRGPWLWVTTGPASRGYVSPVFLPDAGPCLACLISAFQRLSPVPQLYEVLDRHSALGGEFSPARFPAEGLAVLESLVRWKVGRLGESPIAPAVFRLHVLELESMEVSLHRVYRDPNCPECHDAGVA